MSGRQGAHSPSGAETGSTKFRSVSEFVGHYRFERNHQGLGNELIEGCAESGEHERPGREARATRGTPQLLPPAGGVNAPRSSFCTRRGAGRAETFICRARTFGYGVGGKQLTQSWSSKHSVRMLACPAGSAGSRKWFPMKDASVDCSPASSSAAQAPLAWCPVPPAKQPSVVAPQ